MLGRGAARCMHAKPSARSWLASWRSVMNHPSAGNGVVYDLRIVCAAAAGIRFGTATGGFSCPARAALRSRHAG